MSATTVRRSSRLAGRPPSPPAYAYVYRAPDSTTATAPLRRSRRLAGLPPEPPAHTLPVPDTLEAGAISWKATAERIGRVAYRLSPSDSDVTDKDLFAKLLHLTGLVMDRILMTGDDGRFRSLTKAEVLAWMSREPDRSHIYLTAGMIRAWMHVPYFGQWHVPRWEEKHVEIAMRQHPLVMAALEAAMGPR